MDHWQLLTQACQHKSTSPLTDYHTQFGITAKKKIIVLHTRDVRKAGWESTPLFSVLPPYPQLLFFTRGGVPNQAL